MKGFPDSVKNSELTSAQTPSLNEFRAVRHLTSSRVPEPRVTEKCPVTKEELHQFYKILSKVPTSHVQFLYRQRWEACRLNPGGLPHLTDIQYLEATLRLLEARSRERIEMR